MKAVAPLAGRAALTEAGVAVDAHAVAYPACAVQRVLPDQHAAPRWHDRRAALDRVRALAESEAPLVGVEADVELIACTRNAAVRRSVIFSFGRR